MIPARAAHLSLVGEETMMSRLHSLEKSTHTHTPHHRIQDAHSETGPSIPSVHCPFIQPRTYAQPQSGIRVYFGYWQVPRGWSITFRT